MGKNRKKNKNKSKKKEASKNVISLRLMPEIIGGEFSDFHNDIGPLQAEIDKTLAERKGDYKRRILFSTEASYLLTGFSTYLREIMRRLHATGKFELAELGSYGNHESIDNRAGNIPWKYYHNMPATPVEEAEYNKDYNQNQFGKWKLSYVLADFKPDIILLHRDNWMDTHVLKNHLKDNCLVFWMPTVDGFPQKWDWLKDYAKLDKLFTYSWFGKRVLEEQSTCQLAKRYGIKPLLVDDVIQPGVDLDKFKPVPRDQVRQVFNITDPKTRFVGTVMRNQPRKLFPRLIEAFRMFKEQHAEIAKDVFLLLHTSVRDVGWDIPEHTRQNGMEEWVVFSYICNACGFMAVSNYCGSPADCPICKSKQTFDNPNTAFGFNDEQFNMMYNLLDVYVQGTIAEGDGMPLNEAKACGVPVLGSDYSAVYEKVRNGGGIPIKNMSEQPNKMAPYTEHETAQNRSLFDRQDLCDKLAMLLSDEGKRLKLAKEARECAVKYYSWDLSAKKWEYWIETAAIKDREETWNAPVEIKELTDDSPQAKLGDKEFIEWIYFHILSGKKPDSGGFRHWSSVLQNSGSPGTDSNIKCRDQMEEHFRGIIEKENHQKSIRSDPESAITDPVEKVRRLIPDDKKFKILYAIPETFGDVLISTGVIDGIKKRWPESDIYVATQECHFPVLEGNPQVAGLIPYHDSMVNYRVFEKWGPQPENIFDIVFNPYIITQKVPHWIHNGFGPWLGQAYANMCNVKFGNMWLGEDDSIFQSEGAFANLPEKYITVHSQTRTDPKDWDYFDETLEKIKNIDVVQVGGKKDREVKNTIDLRGRTTPQQLHSVIKGSAMHFGGDSFPMHVAGLAGTPTIALFGGTYKQQGYAPCYSPHMHAIETEDRGPCGTSCHLLECDAKKKGFDKCINNIPVERVLEEINSVLGDNYVEPLKDIKISAYFIIRNGVKYGFPFENAIAAARRISDEVIVVDGGSNDKTVERLKQISSCGSLDAGTPLAEVKIFEHEWDMDSPTLFGDEKTYARQLCTGTHLIQLDADEIIQEAKPGQIRELLRNKRFDDVLDLPCINFYGNDSTIRIEDNFWKWRISRNDTNIVHGVTGQFRQMDPESGRITMDKSKSDSCEYIYESDLNICKHKTVFDAKYLEIHDKMKKKAIPEEEYVAKLEELIKTDPVVFHYSWFDLKRKEANGAFWDQTYHGRKNATHNRTEDIKDRVSKKDKEILLNVDFNHPFREKVTT